jgi:hypothetical protein
MKAITYWYTQVRKRLNGMLYKGGKVQKTKIKMPTLVRKAV